MKQKTTYGQFVRHLRESRELSQAAVAAVLGISRSSYVLLEQGQKELSFSEAVALVEYYGITYDELLRRQVPSVAVYTDMLRFFLREAKKCDRTLKKTKLGKLLYLADYAYYYHHDCSLSGMVYYRFEYGPLAEGYLGLIDELEQTGWLNLRQVLREDYHMYEIEETRVSLREKLIHLPKEARPLLTAIYKKWRDADTAEIVAFTKSQQPWLRAEPGGRLSYATIKAEPEEHLF